jgi:hypothetical protein
LPRATPEGDLLVLEGRSKAVDIAWPLTGKINDKTWFVLSVAEGAEQIDAVSLALDLSDGSIVERKIVPNQLQRLGISGAEVRNVRLRILPAVFPYRFKLDEMVLFEPRAATYAEAFSIPLPTPYTEKPKPVLSSAAALLLEVQPGHVAGLVADMTASEPLRFSTVLELPLDSVRGMHLKYRLPPAYLDGEACPLALQFNWANGKTERQLCFEKPNGDLFIPIANWLGASARPQNLGALHSIDWILRAAVSRDRGVMESFDLNFAVEGRTMLSAADRLRLFPMFNAGRTPTFADAERIKEVAAGPYAQNVWLPLDAQTVSRMIATGGQVQPVEDPLFRLDQVVLEPKRPLKEEQWRELNTLPIPSSLPRWPKWLIWASAMLVPLIAWLKGWWSPRKLWELRKATGYFLVRILRWMGGKARRWTWRWLPHLNVAIGLMALGPGLWMAGRLGWSFAGVMLLVCAGLITWAAYHYWRERGGGDAAGGTASIRTRLVVLGVAIGCAIWSLGQFKLSVEALWGFLPLVGAVYALLPTLHRSARNLLVNHPRYVSLGGWLMLTLCLYLLGWRSKADGGENYFFTFGGMAAVFLGRAGLLVLESRLRRHFPRAAERVYGGAGSLYFTEALATLVATAVILSVKLQPIAEQLAIVVYFCLVIGIVKEAWARRKVRPGLDAEATDARAESSAR